MISKISNIKGMKFVGNKCKNLRFRYVSIPVANLAWIKFPVKVHTYLSLSRFKVVT